MIFLFEQFAYKPGFLEKVLPQREKGSDWNLPKGFVQRESKGLCKLDGVGYLYNANCKYVEEGQKEKDSTDRIVFVLPKVFLDESGATAFGQKISADVNFKFDKESKEVPKEFLSNLSLWVCSSIAKYRLSNPADNSIDVPEAPDVRHFDSDKATPSLIDVMNAMKSFYAENQNLFVFTAKNKHSGNNRIDWRRTVSRTQPFMQGGTPIYMNLENKKKVIDVDDRLLVLYFSAMHYIEETFGFKMPHSEFYAPMRVNEFRRLLGHRGLVELRRIKHKYFADKFLRLYNIVKAFFEWGGNFSANDYSSEYLLTSKYNNVFEAMIDKLVGDDLPHEMQYLKSQRDNKEVDHLYKDRQLIFADEDQKIWFIGDSKYYKDGNGVEGASIHKQFTYARNIIQYNIDDLLNSGVEDKDYEGLRYRDKTTEGYSVTPNFFIRGEVPEFNQKLAKAQFQDPYFRDNPDPKNEDLIRKDDADLWKDRNRHFENRLFDRDTLLLQVYNVNFLYVLKAFTSKRSSLREEFKRDARDKFRENFLELLNDKYVFWAVWVKNGLLEDFVDYHFRVLAGKAFKPRDLKCLIIALEKEHIMSNDPKENGENLWKEIERSCSMILRVTPYDLWGEAPKKQEKIDFPHARFDSKSRRFRVHKGKIKSTVLNKESQVLAIEKDKEWSGLSFEKIDGAFLNSCGVDLEEA